VTVESRKYDGRVSRTWPARLVKREGPLVVLDGAFDEEVSHSLLGTIAAGTRSVEFYWEDRWYSVFRFHEPAGGLRNFYCNVNTPVEFDGRVLGYVDLDIDVLVRPDFSYSVLDVEEFEEHAKKYVYPADVVERARGALDELIELIERRRFPFDQTSL
jgi:protein associated with RNAse G/E